MAVSPGRDRRPALWPYLVMPLIVVLVFCALTRAHHHAARDGVLPPTAQSTGRP